MTKMSKIAQFEAKTNEKPEVSGSRNPALLRIFALRRYLASKFDYSATVRVGGAVTSASPQYVYIYMRRCGHGKTVTKKEVIS